MDFSLVIPIAFWVIVAVLFFADQRRAAVGFALAWVAVTFICRTFGWYLTSIALQGALAVTGFLVLKLRVL